jgi:hypothetical protein
MLLNAPVSTAIPFQYDGEIMSGNSGTAEKSAHLKALVEPNNHLADRGIVADENPVVCIAKG